jgi:hypothetical protein
MAELNLTRALKAAGIAWTLGVASFVAAFLLPTSNPDLVANTVLFCAVPLVATVGARFYYQQAESNGFVLGLFMFAVAGSLDAIITVPLLIMPAGGTYQSFYGDPGFWIIGIEYVAAVALYSFCAKPSYKAIPNETRAPATH